MLPFLPPAVQHWIHIVLACAVAVFVVLKSDPTLGAIPWVVGVFTVLNTLNAIFTSAPGDAKELASLQTRVASLLTKMGPAAMLALVLSCGAHIGPIPKPVIDDFDGLVVCIAENSSTWENLLAKCGQWSIDEIIAAIEWLTANPGYAKEHPEMLDTLKARLVDARAHKGVAK